MTFGMHKQEAPNCPAPNKLPPIKHSRAKCGHFKNETGGKKERRGAAGRRCTDRAQPDESWFVFGNGSFRELNGGREITCVVNVNCTSGRKESAVLSIEFRRERMGNYFGSEMDYLYRARALK